MAVELLTIQAISSVGRNVRALFRSIEILHSLSLNTFKRPLSSHMVYSLRLRLVILFLLSTIVTHSLDIERSTLSV